MYYEDFIGTSNEHRIMVSRSLEKMILIAVGLTTAVMIGVPVLLFAINTLNSATEYEMANLFSEKVHEAVTRVDNGSLAEVHFDLAVPDGIELTSIGNTLSISYRNEYGIQGVWTEEYSHDILVESPPETGYQSVTIRIADEILVISFAPAT